jgi:YegS/Rv2252/BmrU family lipid kinase
MSHCRLIVNPASGRGTAERFLPEIERLLSGQGVEFDTVRTERPWHGADLAEKAARDGCDVAVAVGGDGTVNEVLNGLLRAGHAGGRHCALGVVSVGQGNDFAFGARIPRDLAAACRVLALDHRQGMDVARVVGGDYPQGRYAGNGVGIGFDAVVGFEALKMKRLHGFPSYAVAAFKTTFLYFHAPLLRIEHDGGTITEKELMVSIMNGRRMGGGFLMAPHAENDDGLLDVCIAREVGKARVFTLIPKFMKGTQEREKEITTLRTRRIAVTALEGSLPAHADGETLCTAGKTLTIDLLPRAIEVVCQGPGGVK